MSIGSLCFFVSFKVNDFKFSKFSKVFSRESFAHSWMIRCDVLIAIIFCLHTVSVSDKPTNKQAKDEKQRFQRFFPHHQSFIVISPSSPMWARLMASFRRIWASSLSLSGSRPSCISFLLALMASRLMLSSCSSLILSDFMRHFS